MDPARKAKLAGIQARQMATLAQTKEGQEALDRMNARHSPTIKLPEPETRQMLDAAGVGGAEVQENGVKVEWREPPKPIFREIPLKAPFRITGSQSGQCISEMGPCQCGEPKLKWHPICLKVKV